MSKVEKNTCFCGSGLPETACCGPVIEGSRPAVSAEALMRSRYTAYVKGDTDYLLKSWHAKYRPVELRLEENRICWIGLEILQTQAGQNGDVQGMVEFIARYEQGGWPGKYESVVDSCLSRGNGCIWMAI